jgi:hypothetical protein
MQIDGPELDERNLLILRALSWTSPCEIWQIAEKAGASFQSGLQRAAYKLAVTDRW